MTEDKVATGAGKMDGPPYAIAVRCRLLNQPEQAMIRPFLPFDQHHLVRELSAAYADRNSRRMGIVA
ncbi:hypothetical protein DK26_27740 [Bosea sp. WAO]|nr:hypothetical protein DK26_27740 [Bosea sp. WAO]